MDDMIAGPHSSGEPHPGVRVLMIEDSATHAALIKALLAQRAADGFGTFVVQVACDLAEGVGTLQSGEGLDVVLLDLTLPDASGLEGLQAVIECSELPVIVMTGLDDTAIAVQALELGAQDYLVKQAATVDNVARSIKFACQRHELTRRLEGALHQRDLAARHLDDFLAMAAHELGGPMTVVSGMAKVLLTRGADMPTEQRTELLTMIHRQSVVAAAISQQLLALAKGGGEEPESDRTKPADVELGVSTGAGLAGTSPANDGVDGQMAWVDAGHLAVIMRNLLANALVHGSGKIVVRAWRGEEFLHVRVTDDGPGVPEEVRQRLFERWSTGGSAGSHGLGLYLARLLARTNGGDLRHDPDTEGGSFILDLVPA
ncbi:MAG: signal transduction histidine kinase [Glaciecola sp.]|jgi:signal transduction histidine kinase